MSTKLTIDEGNSSAKIALWKDDELLAVTSCVCADEDVVDAAAVGNHPVDHAIFCSVCRRDKQSVSRVLSQFADRVTILDAHTPLPISIDYRSKNTLGADRIAAACGAYAVAPGCTALVVDMGTAITYDVVTSDGRFIGGNIAPGIFVRLEALNHFTRALPLIETDGDVPRWGYDTETAMRSGAIRGVVGELQYYRHCLPSDAITILTGGSTDLIIPHITSPLIIEPNLVLKGLNCIIDYNENK